MFLLITIHNKTVNWISDIKLLCFHVLKTPENVSRDGRWFIETTCSKYDPTRLDQMSRRTSSCGRAKWVLHSFPILWPYMVTPYLNYRSIVHTCVSFIVRWTAKALLTAHQILEHDVNGAKSLLKLSNAHNYKV